jgi:hypothetical protein
LSLKPHEAAEQLVIVPVQLLDPNGAKFRFRTRVSADEVARILRRCHAPEPWNNPSACTDIGTLPMRTKPHPAALAVQKALEDLKRAIAEFNDAELNYFEQARTARNRRYRGEPVSMNFLVKSLRGCGSYRNNWIKYVILFQVHTNLLFGT